MKTLIFIRTTFLFSGLMLMVACQNAKLDKSNPPAQNPPPNYNGSQLPPGPMPPNQQLPPGGGQQLPPQQRTPVYPPAPNRSEDRRAPSIPDRMPQPENRQGPMPPTPSRQTGEAPTPRQGPNVTSWYEKAPPYDKVVEVCGRQECPPSLYVPPTPAPKQDCTVQTSQLGAAKPPGSFPPGPPTTGSVSGSSSVSDGSIITYNPPAPGAQLPPKEGQDYQAPPVCSGYSLVDRKEGQELDLIFIVDNSDSMLVERQKIAEGITQFANSLGLNKHLNVAVVPANGPKGDGYAQVVGNVINVQELQRAHGAGALSVLADQLKHNMSNMPADKSDAQGEVGLNATYALVSKAPYLDQAKAQGLFAPEKAAMFVYVSDENDACYDYEATGARPNYVYPGQDVGAQGPPGDGIGRDPFEARTFMANGVCKRVGPNGENISPDLVYSAIRNLKGSQPVIMSGIVYKRQPIIDVEAVGPYRYEKEIGRGYLDIIERKDLNNNQAYDLNDKNFGSHLANMANSARFRIEKQTVLEMGLGNVSPAELDTLSISVKVVNANGTLFKEYQTRCGVAGANCLAHIGPAEYRDDSKDYGRAVPRVIVGPEVNQVLRNGGKAYITFKTK